MRKRPASMLVGKSRHYPKDRTHKLKPSDLLKQQTNGIISDEMYKKPKII